MTTPRPISTLPPEKPISESQGGPPSDSIRSDIRPSVPSDVLMKLLLFTFAMIIVPIGSYFVVFYIIESATAAGAFAAFMANVVLVGYIVVAMREDQGDQPGTAVGVNTIKAKTEGKKVQ